MLTIAFRANRYKERFALCYGTVVLSLCSICNVGVLWPTSWMDQDATGTEIGLGTSDIVLDEDPASPTERGTAAPPLFGPWLLWSDGRPSQLLLSSCY